MLDPLLSLALNVTNTRGGYALLLGSGISRPAKIPTGWDIVLDLIGQLAMAAGAEPLPSPEIWYRTTYQQDPDYSAIIDSIGGTEEERRQLLRRYFEATEEERAQGLKMPTAAHSAIARLAMRGHVRVVITTNFDRLLEQALEVEGLTPTVISTPDMAAGALPIVHTACTVIKVHGDYMDTRIKNTSHELATYDQRINVLLDEVIDSFGLIVCGWSATWDPALRASLERASTRRFTTYWAMHGEPTPEAKRVIQHRQAAVVEIDSADHFFEALAEKVQALEDLQQANPLSTRVATATLKRLLETDHQIRAYDLMTEEISRLRAQADDAHFPPNAPYNAEELRRRLTQYESLSDVAQGLMAACGYWAKPGQDRIWHQTVSALAATPLRNGLDVWVELARYPALLLLYAHGLAATSARNDSALGLLLSSTIWERGTEVPLVLHVNTFSVMETILRNPPTKEDIWGRAYTPVSDHLHQVLREPLRSYIIQQEEYDRVFDRFEFIVGLAYADARAQSGLTPWGPIGRFAWRSRRAKVTLAGKEDTPTTIEAEISTTGEEWPLLRAGMFGGSHTRLTEILTAYISLLQQVTAGWF